MQSSESYTGCGGLEHEFYDFPYIGNNHPNWRTHIFQRGRAQPPTSYDTHEISHYKVGPWNDRGFLIATYLGQLLGWGEKKL